MLHTSRYDDLNNTNSLPSPAYGLLYLRRTWLIHNNNTSTYGLCKRVLNIASAAASRGNTSSSYAADCQTSEFNISIHIVIYAARACVCVCQYYMCMIRVMFGSSVYRVELLSWHVLFSDDSGTPTIIFLF